MKGKKLLGLLLAVLLLTVGARAEDVTVTVKDTAVPAFAEDGVTYVQLSSLLSALGGWKTQWDSGAHTASAETALFTLDVPIQQAYVLANGYPFAVNGGNLLRTGRTYVPLRGVANLLGAEVDFMGWDNPVTVRETEEESWTEEDLYWLSRIISAESQGECLAGQIAVGNVVLNRVASDAFPDTIKEVIFDVQGCVQFEPVENLTVYNDPTEMSVLAARMVLAGANTVGESLYFFAPALSDGLWIRTNRPYYMTMGCLMFFQ